MPELALEIVCEADVSDRQRGFVNQWSESYFGIIVAEHNLAEASVDWRVFLSEGDRLVSHVAVTAMAVEVDGTRKTVGAIGGLFTIRNAMRQGFATRVMDAAEALVFDELNLPTGILFCLSDLIPFYVRRAWSLVEFPVTLQQADEIAVWPESVMVLPAVGVEWKQSSIHVPG